ncbi:MAG: BREX-1 system phosphatase PglZ type A [Anaerolineales bacterium]|nr:BREX-1 system phosphatase PglZ type A [Anaerolineales bacterium]
MTQIQSALTNLFKKHRIVFWYDAKRELRGEFEGLILPGIEVIELANNEFSVKHRILRQFPEQKFLLYRDGSPPPDLENWLLDVHLASGELRADQTALWLSDLGLGLEFMDVIQSHVEFFNAEKWRMALKALLSQDDTPGVLRLKMLAICSAAEPRLDEILEALLAELAEKQDEKIALIQQCGLDDFLWERLERTYGYQSNTPGIQDFTIELFKSCYALGLGQAAQLSNDALVFLKRWKDSISHHQAFETLSNEHAILLNIKLDLQQQDYRSLVEIDLFRLIDQKIISELSRTVADRTISAGECNAIIRQRRRSHWYKDFQHLYEAIDYAAQFIQALEQSNLSITSLADGVQRYTKNWYRLDQLYRKVIFHTRKSGQISILESMVELVENLYSNNYLLKLNNNWQQMVDTCKVWEAAPYPLQRQFFEKWVAPFLQNKKKVYVIISDALRFEIADEFLSLVRHEDRYDAQLQPALSMLPSYTQLNMAALLPNHEISFAEGDSAWVNVDGYNTQGTVNRDKILKQATNGKAAAMRAEDLLTMNKETCRELLRDNEVVYFYHNRIDSVGDKRESEERVFEAVEEALEELITIIKKLTASNATNLLVTSDHGFIYQNHAIDESDFSAAEVSGKPVLFFDRRFVLGKELAPHPSLKKFKAVDVGLVGDMEIQIPKSITRLRLKGSGSRYVHGGASLQEVVVPVIQINKKRESDVTKVSVDILRGAASIITAGQFSVSFYQVEPVSDKVHLRKLRAGIYTLSGDLISDQHELVFDLESENPRERETPVRFMFTRESNQVNNQEVILRLDEQVPNTSHYQEYKAARYTMRRSFTSDFDF